MTEKMITDAMRKLDLTREEAIEMLQEDEEIDRGADPHPLTAEQEKASKAARIVSTGPRKEPVKRERKPNEAKRFLIDALVWALTTDIEQDGDNVNADDVVVTNPERQIDFSYNGTRYRIVLSAPRK